MKGSYVIEMSYIMPIFLGLFMLIIHTAFYYHDKAVLNGAAGETAVLGSQAARERRMDMTWNHFSESIHKESCFI